MRTLYIQGSKKAANETLNKGEPLPAVEYVMRETTFYKDIRLLREDAVVKFWRKKDGNNSPIAVSYGNWLFRKGVIR